MPAASAGAAAPAAASAPRTRGERWLQLPARRLSLARPLVMGVLNVTPDSFSDGGRHRSVDDALRHAEQMLRAGAAIIDIGGESTRPGAEAIPAAQEIERVMPVVEALRARFDCVLSVDTRHTVVMREACSRGAELINDINALREQGAVEALRDSGAAVCLMHMQGQPQTMQRAPVYRNVVREVAAFLVERAGACEEAGVASDRILVDPGFGFGKTLAHNLSLLAHLDALAALGYPLLVGLSRKRMLGQLTGREVDDRLAAGIAAAALAATRGAAIVRTHDVAETVDALRLAAAINEIMGE